VDASLHVVFSRLSRIFTSLSLTSLKKQDVIRVDGLIGSLAGSFVADPTFMPQIVAHVGIPTLVEWLGHVGLMGVYGVLDNAVTPVATPFVDKMNDARARFLWRRRFEAWRFGSGNDYQLPDEN
jgi:lycopene cyclase CruP